MHQRLKLGDPVIMLEDAVVCCSSVVLFHLICHLQAELEIEFIEDFGDFCVKSQVDWLVAEFILDLAVTAGFFYEVYNASNVTQLAC